MKTTFFIVLVSIITGVVGCVSRQQATLDENKRIAAMLAAGDGQSINIVVSNGVFMGIVTNSIECVHEGRLDRLPPNWRVDITEYVGREGRTVEVGVCKRCGKLTDSIMTTPNAYSHWPIAQ